MIHHGFFARLWNSRPAAILASVSFSLWATGCSEGTTTAPSTTTQACSLLQASAGIGVRASGYLEGPAPVVRAVAEKYIIELPVSAATPDAHAGHVRWLVETRDTYGLYRTEEFPYFVRNAEGDILPFDRQLGANVDCPKIGRATFITLDPGEYELEFAATIDPAANMVILPLAPGDTL